MLPITGQFRAQDESVREKEKTRQDFLREFFLWIWLLSRFRRRGSRNAGSFSSARTTKRGFDSPHPLLIQCWALDVRPHRTSNSASGGTYRPPKNRLNELNKRPGKLSAFCGPFGALCANGHCEPPCTWQATVGILSTGNSMSKA